MNALARARTWGAEMVDELKKVTWPDWPQLKNATLVILVFVVAVSAIIWLMDVGIRTVLQVIIDFFTG